MENNNEIKNEENHLTSKLEEIDISHTKKSWFSSLITGFLIGLAVILPGISGSTFAIIFKVYDKMLYAISNIFKKFKKAIWFLFPIILGGLVGFILGFLLIQKVIEEYTFLVVCIFGGLMLGASKEIYFQIKGSKTSSLRISLLVIGFCFPIVLAALFANVSSLNLTSAFENFPIWIYFVSFFVGILVSITQLVPGLSATVLLMSIGFFQPIMDNLHFDILINKPSWIIFLACLVIGFLVGFFLFSKVMSFFFAKYRVTTFYLLTGLTFGSIISIFYNSDTLEVYRLWANNQGHMGLDLGLGIPLFCICICLTYFLVSYQQKKDREKIEKENSLKD